MKLKSHIPPDQSQLDLMWQIRKYTIQFVKKHNIDIVVRPIILRYCRDGMHPELRIDLMMRGATENYGEVEWSLEDGVLRVGMHDVDLSIPRSIKEMVFQSMEEHGHWRFVKPQLSWWRRILNREWKS